MSTPKKIATPPTRTAPASVVVSQVNNSELESRVQALEEKVVDLIKRLEKKLSF